MPGTKSTICVSFLGLASLKEISAYRGKPRYSYIKPFWMKDHYNHKSEHNWNTVYDTYNDARYQTQSLDTEEDPGQVLKEILADPAYVVVDTRLTIEKYMGELDSKYSKVDLKAHYTPEVQYNDIKENPFRFIKHVAGAIGMPLDPDFNIKKPINKNRQLRNEPLLILCESQFCGCRWAWATWHGFNNVRTINNVNDYLPGGPRDAWEGVELKSFENENGEDEIETPDWKSGDYDWDSWEMAMEKMGYIKK